MEHKAFHCERVRQHSAYAQYGIGLIEIRMKINLPKRRDAAVDHKSQSSLPHLPATSSKSLPFHTLELHQQE